MFWPTFADVNGPNQTPPRPAAQEVESPGQAIEQAAAPWLPWAVSLLLHAAIIVLVIFLAWLQVEPPPIDPPVVVPISGMSKTPGRPVVMPKDSAVLKGHRQANAARPITPASFGWSISDGLGSVGGAGGDTGGTDGSVGGPGSLGELRGRASAGPARPFQSGSASGGKFDINFMGVRGNARDVAFLIDASGSLIDTLPFVLPELQRSVSALQEKQSFTVLFFQDGQVIEMPPKGFKKASSLNKQRLVQWLQSSNGRVAALGATSPLDALQTALGYRPHLLYILSDNITGSGRYQLDQKDLLREVRQVNRAATTINTIQFIYRDPLTELGMQATLELIAEQNHGLYKFLDARELGI